MDTCFPQDGVVTGQLAAELGQLGGTAKGQKWGKPQGPADRCVRKTRWSFRVIRKAQAQTWRIRIRFFLFQLKLCFPK